MKIIAQVLIAIAVVIAIQCMLVKYGEPQSVWLYCDVLNLCDNKRSDRMSEDNYYNPNAETSCDYYTVKTDAVLTFALPEQNRNVTFNNANNEVVGTLDFNGEEMKFTGNADESAQIFINFLREWWGMENDR